MACVDEAFSIRSVCGEVDIRGNCAGCDGSVTSVINSGLEITRGTIVSIVQRPFTVVQRGTLFYITSFKGDTEVLDFDRATGAYEDIIAFRTALAAAQAGCGETDIKTTFEQSAVNFDDGTNTPDPLTVGITVGDTVITQHPNGYSYWTWNGTNWVFDWFDDSSNNVAIHLNNAGNSFDPGALPANPSTLPVDPNTNDTIIEYWDNGKIYWTYDGANWNIDFFDQNGCCTYFNDEAGNTFNEGAPPAAPLNPPTDLQTNDTVIEFFDNGNAYWTWDGAAWNLDNFDPDGSSIVINEVADIAARDAIAAPGNADVAIMDSVNDCDDKGLSFYNINTWTTPLVLIQPENQSNVLYVDKNGDNTRALLGNSHWPYSEPIFPVINNYAANRQVKVLGGVYTWGVDVPLTAAAADTQLARTGEEINYTFENGTRLVADGGGAVLLPFGFGTFLNNNTNNVKLSIDGYGEFVHTNTVTDVAVPAYGVNSEFWLKAKSITTTGAVWPIQVSAQKSFIEVDLIESTSRTVYSSWRGHDGKHNRYFKLGTAIVDATNPGNGGILRMQYDGETFDGTTDHIEVGSVMLNGDKGATYYCASTGGTTSFGTTCSFHCGGIYNTRTDVDIYPDYLNNSTATANNNAEIIYAGSTSSFQNSSFSAIAGTMITSIAAAQINGFILDNSIINIEVGAANTSLSISVGLFNPHMMNNSHIVVRGQFINTSTNQPCGMFYYPDVDATSTITYENCKFVSSATGKAAIQIANGSASGRLIFKNCTFLNDGTVPPITTNSGAPIAVVIDNCKANSLLSDPNITELVDLISRHPDVI